MSFKTNILQSHTFRQLAGASIGMLVAGVLYVGIEQIGSMKLGAMLVQPNTTVSENADKVATAHETIDDDTARRLGQRAQAVSDQMKQYTAMVQPQVATTELQQHTQARLSQRQQQLSTFATNQAAHAAAPVYAGNPDGPVDQLTRLAQRAEQARQLREETLAANVAAKTPAEPLDLAALVKSVKENPVTASSAASAPETIVAAAEKETLHSGAPLASTSIVNPPKRLTSSGAKENMLALMTLAGCIGMYLSDPLRRSRLLALVTR